MSNIISFPARRDAESFVALIVDLSAACHAQDSDATGTILARIELVAGPYLGDVLRHQVMNCIVYWRKAPAPLCIEVTAQSVTTFIHFGFDKSTNEFPDALGFVNDMLRANFAYLDAAVSGD